MRIIKKKKMSKSIVSSLSQIYADRNPTVKRRRREVEPICLADKSQ